MAVSPRWIGQELFAVFRGSLDCVGRLPVVAFFNRPQQERQVCGVVDGSFAEQRAKFDTRRTYLDFVNVLDMSDARYPPG